MTQGGGDGRPWYRHVWPWFIVGLLGVSVVGSVATVVVAFRGQDALVRDDWYKDGLAINRSLESLERARQQGIRAELDFGDEAGRVVVTLRGEGTDDLAELRLVLSHATRRDHDREVVLRRVSPGRYDGAFATPPPGRYYATLQPAPASAGPPDAEPSWRLSRAFYAGASPTVALGEGG